MAVNALEHVIPILTLMVIKALEPYTAFLGKWNTDYQPSADWRGTEIRIPKPDETMDIETVTPGVVPTAANAVEPVRTSLLFDKANWVEVRFELDDWEKTTTVSNYWEAQINAATMTLLRQLERRVSRPLIAGAGRAISRWDAGTGSAAPPDTLFGPKVAGVGAKARPLPLQPIMRIGEHLTVAEAPMGMRSIILDEVTYYGLQALDEFNRADWSGAPAAGVQTMGMLGNKFGMSWSLSGGCQTKEADGTAVNRVVNGAQTAGDTTEVPFDGGGGNFKAGDVIAFGNHPYSYVVAEDAAASPVKLRSPLLHAVADNETITIVSKGRKLGLACHRDFAILATKIIPAVPGESMNATVGPLNVRVVAQRQDDQTQFKLQCSPAQAVHYEQFGVIMVL